MATKFTTNRGDKMSFPIFESYQGELITELQTLAFDLLCGTLSDSRTAQVDFATPPESDFHYIRLTNEGGSTQPFVNRSDLNFHQPPNDFYETAKASAWVIPDPDVGDPQDREFYTLNGTKIVYRYYVQNPNSDNPRLIFGFRYISIRHEGEYKNASVGMDNWFGSIDWSYNEIKQLNLSVYYIDKIKWRDNGNWFIPEDKAYGFMVSGRTTSGSSIAPSTVMLLSQDAFTLSDGSDDVKPDVERNTTKPGGYGYGGMSGANPAFHLSLNEVNALGSWGSTTGLGLTYYKITESDLHTVLRWIYSWGVARDNSYLRSCIVCAQKVPGVVSTTGTNVPLRIADQTLPGFNAPPIFPRVTRMPEMSKIYIQSDANNDASDYEQMEVMLHLPFVGTINLDPKICCGNGTVFSIEGFIDDYTGNVTYYVYTKSPETKSNQILYGMYTGCGALTIPIVGGGAVGTQIDYVRNRNSAMATGLTSVISMVGGVASAAGGNPMGAGAFVSGMAGLTDADLALQKSQYPQISVDKSGSVDPSGALTENRAISLTFSIPVKVVPENYAAENGKPAFVYKKVSQLTAGRHEFSALFIDTIADASEGEKDAIRSILTRGVIIK